ncbi:ABC transporter permease [Methylocella sp. CPCC 101449]|uniref:ABC transporter permease n=1 Tax=Methylocella sp. CPCC 101449 TaxID=2987531 RepID=UPI00288EE011|nr:ABC transporter permease [Methylocella sp. CPCC 101449]MDT2023478.1 ABC transporter permease [Methylocella sp. CPCC 101449]
MALTQAFARSGQRRSWRWQTLGYKLLAWSPLIILLIAWEATTRAGLFTPFMLPSLSSVFGRIADDYASGDLMLSIGTTLWRALAGFAISAVLGVALGILISQYRLMRWFFDPIISVGFPMPKIAFLPIMILWLGLFDVSKITMIAFNAIFPVVTATIAGIEGVEKQVIWSARNLGTSRQRLMWDILLPAASPQILTGLQVALPIALIVGVLTEMAMGGYGVGAVMQTASRMADSPGVFAGIIEIAIVGYVLVRLMNMVRRWLLRWHPESLDATAS